MIANFCAIYRLSCNGAQPHAPAHSSDPIQPPTSHCGPRLRIWFLSYKPFLPGLATFEDVQEPGSANAAQPEAVFDRVVFMVVDALRSDFVYGYNSGFAFTQR
jgi:hypothetical protein